METDQAHVQESSASRRGAALFVIVLSSFLVPFMMAALNVAAFLHCQRLAFAIFAGLCLIGTFASLVRGKPGQGPATP
jgi:hypothetical protein